ncbi:muramoyltetrapeptide carboxypeptidase [Spirosomataceae bacterium TFI 002]|nr:muramoyltetrapeptide carboxypeptidase [Spirosomataceae bacterium TFI 002]
MNKTYISPPYLREGDKVGICSMASAVSEEAITKAVKQLEAKGFEVVLDENILAWEFNFAGNDAIRLHALQSMLDNPEIKAVFSSRGGYGVSKITDDLNFDKFIENPKWIVGFSDITALHMKIQSIGFQSIHGPMPSTFGYNQNSFDLLIETLNGKVGEIITKPNSLNRTGTATAPIIGGNLCLLAHNVGSSGDFSFDNHLLYIEDIGEYAYNIDRMLVQLQRAGKLNNLAGLIIGDFSDVRENDSPFGKTVEEIILSHVSDYSYPVCFDFPIGHEKINLAVKNGAIATLESNIKQSKLTYNDII